MKYNDGIEIFQVANGFLVRGDRNFLLSETLVFRSMAELTEFLRLHFTHRSVKKVRK